MGVQRYNYHMIRRTSQIAPHSRSGLEALVIATLYEFREADVRPIDADTIIFGDGAMDSMGLVVFLAELEARISEATGDEVVLASERAMSRFQSPYRTVSTLVAFIRELLEVRTP